MKYDIELSLYGKKFRFKNVEATNEDEAVYRAFQKAKKGITFCSIQPSPLVREELKPNATEIPPMSGEDMFRQFFGKN
jgi:hypothetical protein